MKINLERLELQLSSKTRKKHSVPWIGRVQYENQDIIWGLVRYQKKYDKKLYFIAFWGKNGSQLEYNHKLIWKNKAIRLILQKTKNGYMSISVKQDFATLYPDYKNQIINIVESINIFRKLQNENISNS